MLACHPDELHPRVPSPASERAFVLPPLSLSHAPLSLCLAPSPPAIIIQGLFFKERHKAKAFKSISAASARYLLKLGRELVKFVLHLAASTTDI